MKRTEIVTEAYGVTNIAAGFMQPGSTWRMQEYVRVDNVANRRYAGSVVVNDANLRFYEPAPGRSYTAGVQARLSF